MCFFGVCVWGGDYIFMTPPNCTCGNVLLIVQEMCILSQQPPFPFFFSLIFPSPPLLQN